VCQRAEGTFVSAAFITHATAQMSLKFTPRRKLNFAAAQSLLGATRVIHGRRQIYQRAAEREREQHVSSLSL